MKRALRRHHLERLKKKWRKIQTRFWNLGRPTWEVPPQDWLQRWSGIRVNHPRHFCTICKRERYSRKQKWGRGW